MVHLRNLKQAEEALSSLLDYSSGAIGVPEYNAGFRDTNSVSIARGRLALNPNPCQAAEKSEVIDSTVFTKVIELICVNSHRYNHSIT